MTRPRSVGGYSQRMGRSAQRTNEDLESAWVAVQHARDDVEQMRRELVHREREVAHREAAVYRAEVRNQAAARQLNELRHRLDDYGEQLEQGIGALSVRHNQLRQDRRHVSDKQARARHLWCDDIISAKLRDRDGLWTPSMSIGM